MRNFYLFIQQQTLNTVVFSPNSSNTNRTNLRTSNARKDTFSKINSSNLAFPTPCPHTLLLTRTNTHCMHLTLAYRACPKRQVVLGTAMDCLLSHIPAQLQVRLWAGEKGASDFKLGGFPWISGFLQNLQLASHYSGLIIIWQKRQ